MPKSVQRKRTSHFLFCFMAAIVLFLSLFNVSRYFDNQNVLGVTVQASELGNESQKEREFWEDFLTKNPNYIPGWIELGDFERVKQIDPNYFLGL